MGGAEVVGFDCTGAARGGGGGGGGGSGAWGTCDEATGSCIGRGGTGAITGAVFTAAGCSGGSCGALDKVAGFSCTRGGGGGGGGGGGATACVSDKESASDGAGT
eukprot:jgi/Chlat1/226/Chrsp1S03132